MTDLRLHGIYAILDADAYGDELFAGMRDLLSGGIRLFQYRAKQGVDASIVRSLHDLTLDAGAYLIVNDDYDSAVYADGLHIGQEDIDQAALDAYRAQAPDAIIGVSAHAAGHIDEAPYASYFGVGPLRETASKQVTRPILGTEGITRLAEHSAHPVCAIGGIGRDDLPALAAGGIAMVACIGAFAAASDRRAAAAEYVHIWHELHRRA